MKRNTNSSNKTRRLVLIGALGGISIFPWYKWLRINSLTNI